MIRWKIVGISAGVAFGLSFLLGILSGNQFLPLLLKAFIFGVVFGGLAIGVLFLLDKFVPEVFQSEIPPRVRKQEGSVDIVLSDDAPIFGEAVEEIEQADEDAEPVEYAAGSQSPLAEYSRERKPAATRAEETDFMPGDLEEGDGQSEGDAVPGEDAGESFFSDEPMGNKAGDEAKEESLFGQEPAPPEREEKRPDRNAVEEDVDVLPDMSAFESSFSVPDTGENESGVAFGQFLPGKLGDSGIDKDPDTLAKAVRTIIRRDEKGS